MINQNASTASIKVALLRGGAWIEMVHVSNCQIVFGVALLRGGAWIEILLIGQS